MSMGSVGLEFGNKYREKFGYLIITATIVFLMVILTRIAVLGSGIDPDYYIKYELFYTSVGALLGFGVSQLFIRRHIKAVRRRYR
jgi:uncharacterized membrane protein YgaE (UPF0421/DUF939 family)